MNFLQAYSSNKYTLKKCLTNSFYFFSSPSEKLFIFILLTFEWLLFKIMTCDVLPCIYCYQFGICTSHLLVCVSQRRSKHLHSFFFFFKSKLCTGHSTRTLIYAVSIFKHKTSTGSKVMISLIVLNHITKESRAVEEKKSQGQLLSWSNLHF